MERGSGKHGSNLDEHMKSETESLERSTKEGHVEEFLEKEDQVTTDETDEESGHRLSGSGSSADTYPYRNRGETGGASHPEPKDKGEKSTSR